MINLFEYISTLLVNIYYINLLWITIPKRQYP